MSLNKFQHSLFLILFLCVSCSQTAAVSNESAVQNNKNTDVKSAQMEKQIAGETDGVKDYYAKFKQCDSYVSNGGKDSNDGSFENPYKTHGKAIAMHKSGGVICLMGGVYSNVSITDIRGTKEKPFVLMKAPQSGTEVRVTSSSYAYKTGVQVLRSSHVYIIGLKVSHYQKGISFDSVKSGGIIDNQVSEIGLDGLHVGQNFNYNTLTFGDYPSENVVVLGNHVDGTGYQDFARSGKRHRYGEGIYIGTGAKFGDRTHDILVKENTIHNTSAEGVEVKPGTYNVQVIDNRIADVNLSFKGAITVAIGSGDDDTDGNYQIIGNTIENVTTRGDSIGGIAVGDGNAIIQGNTIRAVEGGIGIRVYKSFPNPRFRKVIIKDNVIITSGLGESIAINNGDHGHPGLEADVDLIGNVVKEF